MVVGLYFLAIAGVGFAVNRQDSGDARDYFLASGQVPAWLAATSVLATTQSAATFLGGPDFGYRGDFTYLSTFLGAFLAVVIVAHVFIPRFYANNVTTVYELLGQRFGAAAMKAAGGMFLVGRVIAGGARLYLAAIAVAMIIFGNVTAANVSVASAFLILASFLFAFHKGLKAIVWIDLLQFIVYVGAAIGIALLLLHHLDMPLDAMIQTLSATPDGHDKLRLFDLSTNFSAPFSLAASLTGIVLLFIGNYALDQDTTQRLLACRDARTSAKGLYMSIAAAIPIVGLFIAIGSLLYLFYRGPAAAGAGPARAFQGEDITVLMHFILTEAPAGIRGMMAIGVIATAVGTTMSALNAMSSVLIQDFYRPWHAARHQASEHHYVMAGRFGMAAVSAATLVMAIGSYYWQHYTRAPLLDFVLSVMNFAYAGLLGVYFTALFTKRGSSASVMVALAGGFAVVLALQPAVARALSLPVALQTLAFPWQLCVGTLAAFALCACGRAVRQTDGAAQRARLQEI
jgi:Na+/proline symporter